MGWFIPVVESQQYLIPAEVAELRRMKATSLAAERYRGDGPPYITSGNRVLYPRDELELWLAEQVVRPTKDKANQHRREISSSRRSRSSRASTSR